MYRVSGLEFRAQGLNHQITWEMENEMETVRIWGVIRNCNVGA